MGWAKAASLENEKSGRKHLPHTGALPPRRTMAPPGAMARGVWHRGRVPGGTDAVM